MEQGEPFCFTTHTVKTMHSGVSVSTSIEDKHAKGEKILLRFYCGDCNNCRRPITPQNHWKATLELRETLENKITNKTTLTITVESDNITESWRYYVIPEFPETLRIEAFLKP